MSKKDLILIGAGGHCKSSIEIIEAGEMYAIRGIVDKTLNVSETLLSYPIIGNDDQINSLINPSTSFLITIGQIKSFALRVKLFEFVTKLNGIFATVISPTAIISKRVSIDFGTIVFHHSIINANASIGKNVIINNRALIEHDSKVGDHCHISTGAIVNGNCKLEDSVFLGSNSVVIQGTQICSKVVIGAGSVVLKNINEKGVYAGSPARKIGDYNE